MLALIGRDAAVCQMPMLHTSDLWQETPVCHWASHGCEAVQTLNHPVQ